MSVKKRVYLCENSEKRKNLWEKSVELSNQYSVIMGETRSIIQNETSYAEEDNLKDIYEAINEDIKVVNYRIAQMEQLQKETFLYLREIKKELEIFREPAREHCLKMLAEELAKEGE